MRLQASKIFRGGVTSQHQNYETSNVFVKPKGQSIALTFKISSKGGGFTRVSVESGGEDFREIIKSMIVADRKTAMEVLSEELAAAINGQPEFNQKICAS